MNEKFSLPDKMIHRQKEGLHIFVNPYRGGKFVTDETGARVVELMRRERDGEKLAELVAAELDINPYEAAARLLAFSEKLGANRIFTAGSEEDSASGSMPGTGFIEITRVCDTRCRLCYVSSGEEMPDTLSREEILATIDQMAGMGIGFIALSGGDPLTRGDVLEILADIRSRGLTAGVSTSLLSLEEETAREMARLGVLVQVSIDGSSPEINDWNRGAGSFDKAMRGLELLRKHRIPFRFAFVINRHNMDDIENMVALGIEKGALEVAFGKVRIAGRAARLREEAVPTSEEMAGIYHRLYRQDVETRRANIKIRCKHNQGLLTGLGERVGCLPCGAGRTFIQVSYNGDIVPCSLLSGIGEFVLGNVRRDRLEEVWKNSPTYAFFRNTTVEDIEICRGCPEKYLCGGGCRADAYLGSGDLYGACDDCADLVFYYDRILERGCNEKHVKVF